MASASTSGSSTHSAPRVFVLAFRGRCGGPARHSRPRAESRPSEAASRSNTLRLRRPISEFTTRRRTSSCSGATPAGFARVHGLLMGVVRRLRNVASRSQVHAVPRGCSNPKTVTARCAHRSIAFAAIYVAPAPSEQVCCAPSPKHRQPHESDIDALLCGVARRSQC